MKKLTDYCKTFSADVTRTNEELKLQIEQREFDREEGREEGEELKLIKMICKKIVKKKTPEEIAEDLDEDYSEIKIIYDEALKHAPEYEAQDIYSALHDGVAVK